jgi:cysteinyl-tRNA synthetase
LRGAKSANPSEKAKALADSIVSSFEENMNSDLNVKAAFDELYEKVSELHRLMRADRLSVEDANAAMSGLRRIDSVLQVVF